MTIRLPEKADSNYSIFQTKNQIMLEEKTKDHDNLDIEVENQIDTPELIRTKNKLYITIALLIIAVGIIAFYLIPIKKQLTKNKLVSEQNSNTQIGNVKDTFDFTIPKAKLISDYANLLNNDDIKWFEAKLTNIDVETSNQIAILIIDSLKGIPIENYALKVFNTWGIGNKDTNNGVLILVSSSDRKIRIEISRSLESIISNERVGAIISKIIFPNFKAGKYFDGLKNAIDDISNLVNRKSIIKSKENT